MVLKKNKAGDQTLFIDASNEFVKVTNNNKLTRKNLDTIVSAYADRIEKPHFSHLAAYEEIRGCNYNLSVSTYVEAEDIREKIDIEEVNARIADVVAREDELRKEIQLIMEELRCGSEQTGRIDS